MAILDYYFYKVKEKNFELSARERDDVCVRETTCAFLWLAQHVSWVGWPASGDASSLKAYILLTSYRDIELT